MRELKVFENGKNLGRWGAGLPDPIGHHPNLVQNWGVALALVFLNLDFTSFEKQNTAQTINLLINHQSLIAFWFMSNCSELNSHKI